MPGQQPIELARFQTIPADADLQAFTRDIDPAWQVTIERTLLDSALLSPRPSPTRHYLAGERMPLALPPDALDPVIERYDDAAAR